MGATIMLIARAWPRMPATYWNAIFDEPRLAVPVAEEVPTSLQVDEALVVRGIPLPFMPQKGFGMKVAEAPCFSAIVLTTSL